MIGVFLLYLLTHLLLYVALLRDASIFRKEWPIFLYHAIPASMVAAFALSMMVIDGGESRFARAAIVVGIQGIYSLSFLELWSLSQGGYSLRILAAIAEAEHERGKNKLFNGEQFGETKRAARIAGLRRLGLIRLTGDHYILTTEGRLAAGALGAVARLSGIRQMG